MNTPDGVSTTPEYVYYIIHLSSKLLVMAHNSRSTNWKLSLTAQPWSYRAHTKQSKWEEDLITQLSKVRALEYASFAQENQVQKGWACRTLISYLVFARRMWVVGTSISSHQHLVSLSSFILFFIIYTGFSISRSSANQGRPSSALHIWAVSTWGCYALTLTSNMHSLALSVSAGQNMFAKTVDMCCSLWETVANHCCSGNTQTN